MIGAVPLILPQDMSSWRKQGQLLIYLSLLEVAAAKYLSHSERMIGLIVYFLFPKTLHFDRP
jgi:hypothetical protein